MLTRKQAETYEPTGYVAAVPKPPTPAEAACEQRRQRDKARLEARYASIVRERASAKPITRGGATKCMLVFFLVGTVQFLGLCAWLLSGGDMGWMILLTPMFWIGVGCLVTAGFAFRHLQELKRTGREHEVP